MPTSNRATKKQQQLLEFVQKFTIEHDYSPSYREIMSALGYKSVSTVASHVEGLIKKGFLERRENEARSLEVVTNSIEKPIAIADIISFANALAETSRDNDTTKKIAILADALEIMNCKADADRLRRRVIAEEV